jgi:uncharacterized protein YbjT (DUF2867 family)
MSAALDGVRTVVLTSHGLVPPTRDNHPGLVDDEGNRRMIDAASQAGVGHIVFISVAPVAGQSTTLFATLKYGVEDYLRGSGVPYTVLRPTVFAETHALLLLAEPLREKGVVQFFGPGVAPLNWISADDVAGYVVRALDTGAGGRTEVIGGPDNLSRRDVLELIEGVLGRKARRKHVPVAAMRAMRVVIGTFHPGMRYLLDMALAEAATSNGRNGARHQQLDWTGPTTVTQVVQRWADARGR